MFSFDLSEIKKLYDLISNHTYRELELPNGYKSVMTDAKGMIESAITLHILKGKYSNLQMKNMK